MVGIRLHVSYHISFPKQILDRKDRWIARKERIENGKRGKNRNETDFPFRKKHIPHKEYKMSESSRG